MPKKAKNMKDYSDLKKRLEIRVSFLYKAYKRGTFKLEDLSPGLADMIKKLDENESSDNNSEPLNP